MATKQSSKIERLNRTLGKQAYDAQAVVDAAKALVWDLINTERDEAAVESQLSQITRVLDVASDLLQRIADKVDVDLVPARLVEAANG